MKTSEIKTGVLYLVNSSNRWQRETSSWPWG